MLDFGLLDPNFADHTAAVGLPPGIEGFKDRTRSHCYRRIAGKVTHAFGHRIYPPSILALEEFNFVA